MELWCRGTCGEGHAVTTSGCCWTKLGGTFEVIIDPKHGLECGECVGEGGSGRNRRSRSVDWTVEFWMDPETVVRYIRSFKNVLEVSLQTNPQF